MPAYNAAQHIAESIKSALDQTWRNIELVIVNDGSTDETDRIVQEYLSDERVLYFQHDQNKGLPATRNTGIRISTGEYIAFLDSDDLWHREKLQRQMEYFEHMEVDLVHTRYQILDNDAYYTRKLSRKAIKHLEFPTYESLLCHNGIGVLTVVIKREVIAQIGDFDESLWTGEDWDMWIRLAKAGKRFGFLNDILATYRIHGGTMTQQIEIYGQAVMVVLSKHLNVNHPIPENVSFPALSNLHYAIGVRHCINSNFKTARINFLKSLRFNWRKPKTYLYLLFASLRINPVALRNAVMFRRVG